jgi:hypothetical protein
MTKKPSKRIERPADVPEQAAPSPRPTGGKLVWKEEHKNLWTAEDAHIKRFTNGPEERFYVNRDKEYLGSNKTLDEAKERAQKRIRAPRLGDLSPEQRAAQAEMERREVEAVTTKRGRAQTEGEKKESRVIAKVQAEAKIAERARKADIRLDPVARIKILATENWRKPGTGAHTRAEFLMSYAGKTVEDYTAAGGNLETLTNAIKAKRAELE